MIRATATILGLLLPSERRKLYWLALAVTLMAIAEAAGIASVLPFLAAIAEPDSLEHSQLVRDLAEALGIRGTHAALVMLGVLVLIALVLRNAFTGFTTWLLLRFTAMRTHSMSTRLLRTYLTQPYSFFLRRGSSEIVKNILVEVTVVVSGVLGAAIQLLAQSVVAILILALLAIVDIALAVSIALVLGVLYGAVYFLMRRKLMIHGNLRLQANTQRFKAAEEAIASVRELKLLNREAFFINRYSQPSQSFAMNTAALQLIAQLPRYALETLTFGGIMVIILYLLAVRRDLSEAFPLMGLYAFAAYRLMPALQQIFTAISSIRFHSPALEAIREDLEGKEDQSASPDRLRNPLPFSREVQLRGVSYSYAESKTPLLKDLDLVIQEGTAVGLTGPTGSGKTTVIYILLGLLPPQSGEFLVDGVGVTDQNVRAWHRNIGYVPQDVYLIDDTITANIAFGVPPTEINQQMVRRAASIAGIHEFIMNNLPDGYEGSIGERGLRISGGERQRLGIARALYLQPRLLLLDEATNGLDIATETKLLTQIRNATPAPTLVLATHRLSAIQHCDLVYVLEGGRIVDHGPVADVTQSPRFAASMARGSRD